MPASPDKPEARRYGEAVADVALAIAEKLVVDGEHERIIAGLAARSASSRVKPRSL